MLWLYRPTSLADVVCEDKFRTSSFYNRMNTGFHIDMATWKCEVFIQESIRTIADASSHSLELGDNLPINEVTEKAFDILGHNGRIHAATDHSCSECSQPYKQPADIGDMDVDHSSAQVKMVVLDGIVMGPTVSFKCYNLIYYKHIIYL